MKNKWQLQHFSSPATPCLSVMPMESSPVGQLTKCRSAILHLCQIHCNSIPEGMVVAMPIYYATGSKWKGFLWSLASGISEPIGGLLGFLVGEGTVKGIP